jgi:hypothetical protein
VNVLAAQMEGIKTEKGKQTVNRVQRIRSAVVKAIQRQHNVQNALLKN